MFVQIMYTKEKWCAGHTNVVVLIAGANHSVGFEVHPSKSLISLNMPICDRGTPSMLTLNLAGVGPLICKPLCLRMCINNCMDRSHSTLTPFTFTSPHTFRRNMLPFLPKYFPNRHLNHHSIIKPSLRPHLQKKRVWRYIYCYLSSIVMTKNDS